MSIASDIKAIVIDNGSSSCKAGFAGEQLPKTICKSIVGQDSKTNDIYVSNDAQMKWDSLSITIPFENGMISNWDDMEKIWNYAFHELNADPSSHPVLLTDNTSNTKENRQKMIQIMLEKFNVPSTYVAKRSVLSLYSAGLLTGVALQSGASISLATPIFEGYYINNTSVSTSIAGNAITTTLQQMLNNHGNSFTTFAQLDIIRSIKEKYCYLSNADPSELNNQQKTIEYSLPDGKHIEIGNEVSKCCEILFQPKANGIQDKGICELLVESINKCDKNIHQKLYQSIIVSGGTTKLTNFVERLEKELIARIPSENHDNIIAPHKRQYAAWIGGSIFASLPTFNQMAITKQEYNESGLEIIRKCH